ncbi:MAG TPA: glycosyltransferase family 2 protein [Blastocatellia bacterium]|nr:glycosyltransferase family 2 protein [Blastocatellia bacterium]
MKRSGGLIDPEAARHCSPTPYPVADEEPLLASIIIVNYNAGEKLLRCLDSVARSIESDCEVVVVDNASTDGNAEKLSQRRDLLFIRSETNLGFGAGCNLGARRSRAKYLIFLNPDTTVEAGWIEALLAPLESCDRAGLATARILLAKSPERINACGNRIHITGITLCRGLGMTRDDFPEVEEVDAVSGAAFAVRRELFEMLDGFDEETFLYMEDTDLSLRARLAGWRTLYAPQSIVYHDYSLRITPRKVFYQERNRYLMLLKTLRWPTLVAMLPVLMLAEIITWGFVILRDRDNIGNKWQAYAWIFANRRALVRKRAATQSLRRARDREILRRTAYRLEFEQAATGAVAAVARFVFNPVFFLLRAIILIVVWW